MARTWLTVVIVCAISGTVALQAEEPSVSYIFPAGGQRGTTVKFRVGGHYLHGEAAFSMYGAGVTASDHVKEVPTVWFEGPIVPLPASQQKEDYPKDHAGQVQIAAEAPLGARLWRVRTSQGVTPAMPFVVGDLPEVVEEEIDGKPIPALVRPPVTINGRIFPREDVDIWTVEARRGEAIWCEVDAARIGSGLDSRLEVLGPDGQRLAENAGYFGDDALVRFTAPADGTYQVRIHDAQFGGLQHYVYRLTISAGPHVELTYPAGGQRGKTTQVQLIGTNVPTEPVGVELPADGSDSGRVANPSVARRLQIANQWTNRFLMELGDLREELEQEPNNEREAAKTVEIPVTLNGRIDSPGDIDLWSLSLAKSQEVHLDLRASRLGSPMDGVLTVMDAAGKELARNDDISGDDTDCRLTFRAPADGKYSVRVADQFASRGGPRFVYRLTATSPTISRSETATKTVQDYRLTLNRDAITVMRGAAAQANVTVERLGGFEGPIELKIAGLPTGVTVNPTTIAAKQNSAQLSFKADATAKVGGVELSVEGVAELDEPKQRVSRAAAIQITRPAEPRSSPPAPRGQVLPEQLALAVGMPTPFKFRSTYQSTYAGQGTTFRRRYVLDRNGYEGPLEIMLADRQVRHLQGVSGAKMVVPAGTTEFEYAVQLPPWLEIGRTSRSQVMAIGEVADADGSRHRVSFTSGNQNEQIVLLADPGPLSVASVTPSIMAREEGAVEVPLRVGRSPKLELPVRLELVPPPHVKGVAAEAVEVPADQAATKLTVRFARGCGPFNMPLLIRATAIRGDDRFVAETALEVVRANDE
jgi:hypothetical protein